MGRTAKRYDPTRRPDLADLGSQVRGRTGILPERAAKMDDCVLNFFIELYVVNVYNK